MKHLVWFAAFVLVFAGPGAPCLDAKTVSGNMFAGAFNAGKAHFTRLEKQGSLVLNMKGFRSAKGALHINVFDQAEGFPQNNHKALFSKTVMINDTLMRIELPEFQYGTYAVAVHHDENADGEVNTSWLGIPVEGIGTSNNVSPRFGPPDYQDARFSLKSRHKILTIELIYL